MVGASTTPCPAADVDLWWRNDMPFFILRIRE
jgi:hypothetical protein